VVSDDSNGSWGERSGIWILQSKSINDGLPCRIMSRAFQMK
jgi:hypothetical protein